MTIIERVNKMCADRKMFRKAVCEACQINTSTWSSWTVANVTSIPSEYVARLATLFNCTCDELITGSTDIITAGDERQFLIMLRGLDWDGRQLVLAKLVEEYRRKEAMEKENECP